MTKERRRMKVLLLSPPYPHLGGEELFGQSGRDDWFPLGVFVIANALAVSDVADVQIYYQADYTPKTMDRLIRKFAPDIVGMTCFTNTRFACFELAHMIKDLSREIKVVLGGAHATFMDAQIMANYPNVDMIIRGYAESAFIEVIAALVQGKDLGRIAGLTWRDQQQQVHRNGNRSLEDELIRDIDPQTKELFLGGLPTWKSLDMISYALPIETTRGCVYTCTFCSRMGPDDRTVIDRTPQLSMRYLTRLFDAFGHVPVYFCDTNFTIKKPRVLEFCRQIKALPFPVEWTCATRVDLVNKDLLMELKSAGCTKIYYGVDSLCRKILPAVGRHFAPETAIKNLNLTVDCGLEADANVIIGFPGETAETVAETCKNRMRISSKVNLIARPFKIMPGGALYYQAVREGFHEDYWLKDQGCEFPTYTGAMTEERIMKYCKIVKDAHRYFTKHNANV